MFVSYRRDDEQEITRNVAAALREGLDPSRVFFDEASMGHGDFLDKEIVGALRRASAMVVVIGPYWVSPECLKRLHNKKDWVRLEVSAALASRRIQTFPLLVNKAKWPAEAELPADLQPLTTQVFRQPTQKDFPIYMDALVRDVEKHVPRPLSPLARLAVASGAVLAPVAVIVAVLHSSGAPPTMGGGVNIAVAAFAAASGSGYDESVGAEVGTLVARKLSDDADRIEIWNPERVGVPPTDEAKRAAWLERRAEQLQADVLIAGVLRSDAFGGRVETYVFIPPDRLPAAGEASGFHLLGEDVVGDASTGVGLRKAVDAAASRTATVTDLAVGIDALESGDITTATARFTSGLSDNGIGDSQRVLLLTLRAAAVGRNPNRTPADDEAARKDYEEALRIDPMYARAQLGLADQQYRLGAADVCGSHPTGQAASLEAISKARAGFEAVQREGPGLPGVDLDVKADFGLGRVAACEAVGEILSGSSSDGASGPDAQSSKLLASVIAANNAGNTRVAELAALAHVELGKLSYMKSLFPEAIAAYNAALKFPQLRQETRCPTLGLLAAAQDHADTAAAGETRAGVAKACGTTT